MLMIGCEERRSGLGNAPSRQQNPVKTAVSKEDIGL